MKATDWSAIAERYERSKRALDYMAEHPLTHNEAIEQTKRLKDENERFTPPEH